MAAAVEFSEKFIREMQALTRDQKLVVLDLIEKVSADPAGEILTVIELPPMFRPGTLEAKFDDFLIRYEIKYTDEDGHVIWLISLVNRTSDPAKRRC